MHELSFAQQILEQVLLEVQQYPGCAVTRIKLAAPISLALEPDSLRFALEALAAGTPAEGTHIDYEERPLQLNCPQCGIFEIHGTLPGHCPTCGDTQISITNRELIIEEIELND